MQYRIKKRSILALGVMACMALEGGIVLAQSSEDKGQSDAKAHDKMDKRLL